MASIRHETGPPLGNLTSIYHRAELASAVMELLFSFPKQ